MSNMASLVINNMAVATELYIFELWSVRDNNRLFSMSQYDFISGCG